MTKQLLCAALAAAFPCLAPAQDAERIAPKPLPSQPATAQPPTPAVPIPADANDEEIITKLLGVALFPTLKQAQEAKLDGLRGLKVVGPDFLAGPRFEEKVIQPYLGKPLSERRLMKELIPAIILYCRAQDHFIVDVILPERLLDDPNVLPLAVVEGKLDKADVILNGVTNSPKALRLRRDLRVQTGEPVLLTPLLEDANWLQKKNPFREVKVGFHQAEQEIGRTDLNLQVKEQFPLRVYTGYDNYGNPVLGDKRFFAGFNLGQIWRWDQQLNYQFTSDIDLERMQSHALTYIVPLPWRHTVSFFGAYSDLDPDMAELGVSRNAGLRVPAQTYQTSLRYDAPLPDLMKYHHGLTAGFDYKRANSTFEFGGETVSSSPAEVGQFSFAYQGQLTDRFGENSARLEGVVSPGGLTDRNTDEDFKRLRAGATSDYYYLRWQAARLTRLPFTSGWLKDPLSDTYTFNTRYLYQYAPDPLLPSETVGLGGFDTVRGYDERLANGDRAWLLNLELRTPEWVISRFWGNDLGDRLQLLAFLDYGEARVLNSAAISEKGMARLGSIGAGLRLKLRKNFLLAFDYGRGFYKPEITTNRAEHGRDRAHLSVLVAF